MGYGQIWLLCSRNNEMPSNLFHNFLVLHLREALKNSQILDIVQKIPPPNWDVLSLDILIWLRPPLPRPLIWTISRKSLVSKGKIRFFNIVDTRKKHGHLMLRDDMSYIIVISELNIFLSNKSLF